LKEYFQKFGEISYFKILYKHDRQDSRGYGFLQLQSKEGTQKILEKRKHKINGTVYICSPYLKSEAANNQEDFSEKCYETSQDFQSKAKPLLPADHLEQHPESDDVAGFSGASVQQVKSVECYGEDALLGTNKIKSQKTVSPSKAAKSCKKSKAKAKKEPKEPDESDCSDYVPKAVQAGVESAFGNAVNPKGLSVFTLPPQNSQSADVYPSPGSESNNPQAGEQHVFRDQSSSSLEQHPNHRHQSFGTGAKTCDEQSWEFNESSADNRDTQGKGSSNGIIPSSVDSVANKIGGRNRGSTTECTNVLDRKFYSPLSDSVQQFSNSKSSRTDPNNTHLGYYGASGLSVQTTPNQNPLSPKEVSSCEMRGSYKSPFFQQQQTQPEATVGSFSLWNGHRLSRDKFARFTSSRSSLAKNNRFRAATKKEISHLRRSTHEAFYNQQSLSRPERFSLKARQGERPSLFSQSQNELVVDSFNYHLSEADPDQTTPSKHKNSISTTAVDQEPPTTPESALLPDMMHIPKGSFSRETHCARTPTQTS
jgi:hypothetical protein